MTYTKSTFVIVAPVIAMLTTFDRAVAQAEEWYPGWHTIKQILLHNKSLEVMLEGGSDCDRVFRLNTGEGNYDVKASALLAAHYSGHEVRVFYSGDLASCVTKLHRFKVRP